MQSLFVFLDTKKVADFQQKMLISAEFMGVCHVIYIFFGSSLGKAQRCQVSSLQQLIYTGFKKVIFYVINWRLSHFSEHLYRRDLGQIGILGENQHFGWGLFFLVGLENSLYKKIVNANLRQKKKKKKKKKKRKIPIVISTISHFWSPSLTNL